MKAFTSCYLTKKSQISSVLIYNSIFVYILHAYMGLLDFTPEFTLSYHVRFLVRKN